MVGYLALVLPAFLLAWAALALRSRAASSKALAVEERGSRPVVSGKVLVLTAAVGGGHVAAGRTVRAELERAGREVVMEDGLRVMSRALSWALSRTYCSQVRHTPRSLSAVFALTSRRAGAGAVRAVAGLFAGRLLRLVRSERYEAVISTYPLVTAALGRLRARGALRVPVVAVIADYGVHPLWVSPGADLHLVVSRRSAELAGQAGGEVSLARIPVDPAFHSVPEREAARAELGIPPGAFVVLVVGGAWGIGDLGGAARCAVGAGAHAIVVTGENTGLKDRLEEEFAGEEKVRILGWSNDLPTLMAASDCLIQNAGGMTCLEAIEVGLPILMFEPILGHGELNAVVMEQEGAARRVRGAAELTALLRSGVRGELSLPAPRREVGAPGVAASLDSLKPIPELAPQPLRSRRVLRPRPVLAGMAALVFFVWSAFATSGVAVAARAFKLDVPGYDPPPGKVALVVRATDPATAAAVEGTARRERAPVAIFADARAAEGLHPAAGITFGVTRPPDERVSVPWRERARERAAAEELHRTTGIYPTYFLPSHRTNLAALAEAPPHARMVMAERPGPGGPGPGVLVVETSGLGPKAARARLEQAVREIHQKDLECVSLARL